MIRGETRCRSVRSGHYPLTCRRHRHPPRYGADIRSCLQTPPYPTTAQARFESATIGRQSEIDANGLERRSDRPGVGWLMTAASVPLERDLPGHADGADAVRRADRQARVRAFSHRLSRSLMGDLSHRDRGLEHHRLGPGFAGRIGGRRRVEPTRRLMAGKCTPSDWRFCSSS